MIIGAVHEGRVKIKRNERNEFIFEIRSKPILFFKFELYFKKRTAHDADKHWRDAAVWRMRTKTNMKRQKNASAQQSSVSRVSVKH